MRAGELNYISTRGEAPSLGFEDVLLAGLARDGGLYVPQSWPTVSAAAIAGLAGKPFAEIAADVIHPFTGDAISRAELGRMAGDVYSRFGHKAVTPLVQIGPNRWILELFHGPTLAFKDVAMQLLARLMDRVLAARGRRATIIGATSGDTGGAAIEAFRGSSRVDVVILFPEGRVSDVQRRMMTTPADANVHAVAVKGTFDDCQALVKGMFNDHAFRDRNALSGVNSINWARIAGQLAYYFAAAVALGSPQRPVSFAVPTGNFGDIFAGYVATRMGLPIERLVIASNVNDILPRTLAGGTYEMREVVSTSSPSMDIQISSNFERYLFEASGRDAGSDPRQNAGARRHAPFRAWPAQGQACARLRRRGRERGRRRRRHPAVARRVRLPRRSAHRLCTGRCRSGAGQWRCNSAGRLGDRPSRKIPRCDRGDHWRAPASTRKAREALFRAGALHDDRQ